MDKKTAEYMESRVKEYKNLQYEVSRLKGCKEDLYERKGLSIGVYNNTFYFEGDSSVYLKKALDKAIDERIAEIEKKMEEI